MNCIYYNSERLRKAGHNKSGTQRYYCNDCKRKFTETLIQRPDRRFPTPVEVACPHCGANNAKRQGYLKSGRKRYYCKECGKYYSEKSENYIYPDLGKVCPICNSTNIGTSGKNPNGTLRYRCRDCNKRFSDNQSIIQPKNIHDVKCPSCRHVGAVSSGKAKDGRQYYKCEKCGHKFTTDNNFKWMTDSQIKEMRKNYKKGMSVKELSKKYGVCEKTIRNNLKDCEVYKIKQQTGLKIEDIPAYIEEQKLQKQLEKERIRKEKEEKARLAELKRLEEERLAEERRLEEERIRIEEEKKQEETRRLLAIELEKEKVRMDMEAERQKIAFEKEQERKRQEEFEKQQALLEEQRIEQERKRLEKQYIEEHKVEFAIKEIFLGQPENKVMEKFNVPNLPELLKPFYKKEVLSVEQLGLIYKFGVQLAVPVEYLAPYVPCSERICREVLSKYKITQPEKYNRTEEEKNFDIMILDKFLV